MFGNSAAKLGTLVCVLFLMIAGSASASLTAVGKPLPYGNVSAGTVQVQDMIQRDQGVQLYVKTRTHGRITMLSLRSATVVSLKYGLCVIGTPGKCDMNTGKAGWKLKETLFRQGQKRQVAFTKIKTSKVTFKLTVHVASSNILYVQYQKKLKKRPKHIPVNNKRKIHYKFVPGAPPPPVIDCSSHHNVNNGMGNAGSCNTTINNVTYVTVNNVTYIECSNVNGGSQWYVVSKQGDNCNSTTITPCDCTPTTPPPCSSCPPPPQTCPNGMVPAPGGGCKDGTTTPPPPTGTPGTNPPPNGGPSDPGSNQCYDEDDNSHVTPVYNAGTGTYDCPPGSYGS